MDTAERLEVMEKTIGDVYKKIARLEREQRGWF